MLTGKKFLLPRVPILWLKFSGTAATFARDVSREPSSLPRHLDLDSDRVGRFRFRTRGKPWRSLIAGKKLPRISDVEFVPYNAGNATLAFPCIAPRAKTAAPCWPFPTNSKLGCAALRCVRWTGTVLRQLTVTGTATAVAVPRQVPATATGSTRTHRRHGMGKPGLLGLLPPTGLVFASESSPAMCSSLVLAPSACATSYWRTRAASRLSLPNSPNR